MMNAAVSVIVPVAADEEMWRAPFDWQLPPHWQLIIAAPPHKPPPPNPPANIKWLTCPRPGRAAQMNAAAEIADNEWLWFVHADTILPANATQKLNAAIAECAQQTPPPILYFDLRFVDGGAKMLLNELGVRLRCMFYANPFGDQALCMTRAVWQQAGGYPEDAACGEDHLLVLRARNKGIGVRRINAAVGTSARRYQREGWLRTILLYRRLWTQQYRQERNRRQ